MTCPRCRGMRWLRTGQIENGTYTIERCESCLTASLRIEAINRYMDNWHRSHVSSQPQEGIAHD